ncbi:MAG: prolyl oligopeptidase family serine peptidase [Verrucomicrobiota bacterium]
MRISGPCTSAVLALLVLFIASSGSGEEPQQRTESFQKTIEKTLSLEFLLSLPDGYVADEKKKWPLVIFLHGAGERGEDITKVAIHGPPKRVEEGADFPFILASPQCPSEEWWTDQPVLELVDYIEEAYRVDPDRIYLTGLSMGGYGTWHFATLAPRRFAAIAPVCGGGVPYKMRWIKHLPIWIFHGAEDRAVPLGESERLVKALEKHGNEFVKFTIYPEIGHDSWTETYNDPEFYDWLLSHRRSNDS